MSIDPVANFLSGYFHEDWPIEAESDTDVVRLFIGSGVDRVKAQQLADQLDVIASSHDAAIGNEWLLADYGCYYDPAVDGLKASEWVRHIATLIRKETA